MNYYDVDAVNYSSLYNLSINPLYYKNKQEEKSEDKIYFTIGSCVDILLTSPDDFDKEYYVEFEEECKEIPTPQLKLYTELIAKLENPEEFNDRFDCYLAVGFKRKSDTYEKIDEEFNNSCKAYYNYLLNKSKYDENNKNKKCITKANYEQIKKIVNSLLTNKFTYKYFQEQEGIENINQLEIYWEYDGIKCKSKLDKILINHKDKTIQIIDLKTTGKSVYEFKNSLFTYRYDLQSSFYYSALYWLIHKSNDDNWSKYKDYEFLLPMFIVESSVYPGTPLIYKLNDDVLTGGLEGFYHKGRTYKGWRQLIEELQWYEKNNIWSYPKEVIENEGVVILEYD